jgi:hypothetical protein
MRIKKFLYLYVLFFFASCSSNNVENKNIAITRNCKWDKITIYANSQRFFIFRDSTIDAIYDKKIYKTIKRKDGSIKSIPAGISRKYFKMSIKDKDSLYSYVYSLIVNPIIPPFSCTDYAGTAIFTISKGQVDISSTYTSIGSLKMLGGKAALVETILSERIGTK